MKKIFLLSVLALFLSACVTTRPRQAEKSADVVKSIHDERQYEYLILPNDMRVLLVSDPEADKAAAAMSIGAGSVNNPPGREGLAHFLEHMLFMGTEKYPDVDAYSSYIKRNGGSDNAFTSDNLTTYFFDIKAEKLEPALDRFAQFFISPLFDAKYVEREANAVHSEYQLKLKDDSRRIDAAEKKSYNPKSPYAQFFVGNLTTLADREDSKVRDDLLAFYNKYYSANIMGLTVIGKEPLPQLRQWVESGFKAVPNRNAEMYQPQSDELLYLSSQLPLEVDVVPLKKLHKLTIGFPVPSQRRHYKTSPMNYAAHFIGDEGQGSLHHLLKEKGWITSLSAGGQNLDDVQGVFNISMNLTESGIEHADEITRHLFEYIDLLRERGVEKWRFEELKRKSELDFRFQEKMPVSSYAMALSGKLLHYPASDLLRGGKVLEEWKPELVNDLLSYLQPQNMTLTLVDPELKTTETEPYYKVSYDIKPISAEQLGSWEKAKLTGKLSLPQLNPFMPGNVKLKPVTSANQIPVALQKQPGFAVWYQQDEEFAVPRAVFMASLELPGARDTAQKAVSLSLLAELVKDELNAWSYPAQLAGLSYSVSPGMEGLTLLIYGYDEKQSVLLEKVLAALRKPRLSDEKFELYKAKMQRNLQNQALERPYKQILGERTRQLLDPAWNPEQKLAALESLTLRQLRDYSEKLFDQVEAKVLIYGNMTDADAKSMSQVLKQELLPASNLLEAPEPRLTIVPKGKTLSYRYDVDHPDSAVVINYQGNNKSIREQAHWRLLGHMLASPFFSALRTEQQLGYVVAAAFSETEDMPGIIFLVQSSAVSSDELQKRMQAFIRDYATKLEAMNDDEFRSHKAGLLAKLLKKDDMMLSRAVRYMDNLERERYSFDFKQAVADAVKSLNKADLLKFYQLNVLQQPRRLLVYSPGTRFPVK
jgi:secreted Zn-dependent insulinase-like peptidase